MQINTSIPVRNHSDDPLWSAAQKIESQFIAEMLRTSGVGKPSDFFSSTGEEQFQSILTHAQADALTQMQGFGLTEQIFNALVRGK